MCHPSQSLIHSLHFNHHEGGRPSTRSSSVNRPSFRGLSALVIHRFSRLLCAAVCKESSVWRSGGPHREVFSRPLFDDYRRMGPFLSRAYSPFAIVDKCFRKKPLKRDKASPEIVVNFRAIFIRTLVADESRRALRVDVVLMAVRGRFFSSDRLSRYNEERCIRVFCELRSLSPAHHNVSLMTSFVSGVRGQCVHPYGYIMCAMCGTYVLIHIYPTGYGPG